MRRDWLDEAKRILAGDTMMLPQIEHLRAIAESQYVSCEEAFMDGMKCGRLGYKTIGEIIAEDEKDPERKAALDRARKWVREQFKSRKSSG